MPVRFEACGLLLALSLTLSVPFLVPTTVGLNVTLIVHLPLAAKLVVQVFADTAKSPVVEIAMLFSATVWLFVRVNVFGALVVPTVCATYVAVAGVSFAGTTPVPESDTVCGLLGALSVNVRVPVREPNTVGVKVTFTMHLAPTGRVVPHVLEDMAKMPLVAMLLMFSVAAPLLVNVTVLAALVVLMTTFPKLNEVGDSVTAAPFSVPTPERSTV